MDSALKSSMQCFKATNKAMQALGQIKRTFKYITLQSFLILYKTYIRPHLEHCKPVWSPFLAKEIDMIEKVQHRSTKLVAALADLPYEDRLRHLDLYSLYCRKQRTDLITIYKLLHNKIQIDSSHFLHSTLLQQHVDMTINSTRHKQDCIYDRTFSLIEQSP